MSFMMRKKKYKFDVNLTLEELQNVPFVGTQFLFAKIRLVDGGSFTAVSERKEVQDNSVKWHQTFSFSCKMSANTSNGVLESRICRISVRKELKGGRSFQKLGFADLNLAEFAGQGATRRRYLLEGYGDDAKQRQDNSTLLVKVDMMLRSGDPCFKAPTHTSKFYVSDGAIVLDNYHDDLRGSNQALGGPLEGSTLPGCQSTSSTLVPESNPGLPMIGPDGLRFGPKAPNPMSSSCEGSSATTSGVSSSNDDGGFTIGHNRHSSQNSQASAGYGSLSTHSRQGSSDGQASSSYNSDSLTKYNSAERQKRLDASAKKNILEEHPRLDSTRVDPDEVIEQLVNTITQNAEDYADEHNDSQEYGLKLFVAKDGTTTLMSSKQGKGLAGQGLQHQGVRTHRDRERDASKPSSASSSTSSTLRSSIPNQPPPLSTQSSSTSSSSNKSRPSSSHTAEELMPPPARPPPISSSSASSTSSSSSETTCLADSTIVKL